MSSNPWPGNLPKAIQSDHLFQGYNAGKEYPLNKDLFGRFFHLKEGLLSLLLWQSVGASQRYPCPRRPWKKEDKSFHTPEKGGGKGRKEKGK
ncbi:hypothetical protein A7Q09_00040 [Methylacidiphilum sp. Yel]|nr:hypothetical protein A7Q09_00040 [Methylacidiphilum sp. Yel]